MRYYVHIILIAIALVAYFPRIFQDMTLSAPLYGKVAIIGGGPAGIAALKALASEPIQFEAIHLFEKRESLGGLWNYGGDKSTSRPHVPSLDPNSFDVVVESDRNAITPSFSPMYKYLETNLISRMMEYRDVHFPRDTATFPPRQQVYKYIQAYVDSIPHNNATSILYNTNVLEVTKNENGQWLVTAETANNEKRQCIYDAIAVANGHFQVPYIPDVEGLQSWNIKSPGSITHAKYFDDSACYRNQRVLVIGNYASGTDIATQVSVTAKDVFVSVKDPDGASDTEKIAKTVGLITKYDFDNDRSVTTSDGKKISGIDSVIFCTGYLYSAPFLNKYLPHLITDGNQVNEIYKQIFYIPDPSLAFLALPKFVVPMPISESQATVVARYFSGRLRLPSTEHMQQDYQKELAVKGAGKTFHNLKFPLDVEYANELLAWIQKDGLDDTGLLPPLWDEQRVKDRKSTKDLKAARLDQIIEHARKLRNSGDDFRLLPS